MATESGKKIKSIRNIPVGIDPDLRMILEAMKQRLEILFGERDTGSGSEYSSQAEITGSLSSINQSLEGKSDREHGHDETYFDKEATQELMYFEKLKDVGLNLTESPGRMIIVPPDAEYVRASSRYKEDEDGSQRFGNVDDGNCVLIESDGTLVLEGDATVWGEAWQMVRATDNPTYDPAVPAVGAPTWAQIANDGAGSIGVFGAHFANDQYVFLNFVMPPGWKEGSIVYPVLRWMPTTDVDPADNVGIGLEYVWANVGEALGSSALLIRDVSTGVNNSYIPHLDKFTDSGIDGTGKTIGSMLLCRLYRQAAAADDYAGTVAYVALGIKYERDTGGARTVDAK